MNEQLKDLHVIEEIAPDDIMYKSAPDHYFLWGRRGLETIQRCMGLVGVSAVKTILDLPSGHGRVLRFLRAAFPDAVITACDIDPAAVDFCAQTFDAQPIYSAEDVRTVALHQSFDLIWCGSLLTHIHANQWRDLLALFSAHLSDSGLLVFTTHGRDHADRLRTKRTMLGLSSWAITALLSDYERFGFGYQNYPGREGYGISLSSASWVCSQIDQTSGLRLALYHDGGWGGQDAVACVKVPGATDPGSHQSRR